MAILVTGGTGYIGSHTVVELIHSGEQVIIIDNLSNSKADVLDHIHSITSVRPVFYHADILNKDVLSVIFSTHEIEAVIHFAGLKAVGESVEKPIQYFHNNVSGTLSLLSIMQQFNCKKIVFSSSATVYGDPAILPIPESADLSTTNPYGTTKLMIEQILNSLFDSDNKFSIALLRYFNPIGAHPSGLIGDNPNGIPNNLMPYITRVALGTLPYLNVFGNDYDTIDGTGVRDYIHVSDLAIGHVKALHFIRNNFGSHPFNLGTGNGYSVLQIINSFIDASNMELPYKIIARRPGDIACCYADPSKANTVLGWSADRDIKQMCADSWNFTQHCCKNT